VANTDYINRRPRINAKNPDLEEMASQTWSAFSQYNQPPHIFRRSNRLVREEIDDAGSVFLRDVNLDVMSFEVTRCADWYSPGWYGNLVPDRPRQHLIRDMLARPDKDVPLLRRFSPVPIFGPDGTLLDAGYHAGSGLLVAPPRGFSLPELSSEPTKDELGIAKRLIVDELLGDFPFTGPSEVAHAVSALLLPYVREMLPSPTPLHMIEKPTPGTGGTLLAQCLSYGVSGKWLAGLTIPRDESEWRRVLLAKLLQHPVIFLLDNIHETLDSAALASAITAETFEDRYIGSSDMATAPVFCLWLATANNPAMSAELVRRTVRIRLDAQVERPDTRTGFRHPNLKAWVEASHALLVWAALTIIQAWIAASRPGGGKTLGMFEPWAAALGGILDVAGIPGFLENLEDLRLNTDSETRAISSFIGAWHAKFGDGELGVAELWGLAGCLDLSGKDEHARKIQLGKRLDSLRDRPIAGFRIERTAVRQRAQQYRLRRL
jgi:hypothetical protein